MRLLGDLIADALESGGDEAKIARVREAAMGLCAKFPVYGD